MHRVRLPRIRIHTRPYYIQTPLIQDVIERGLITEVTRKTALERSIGDSYAQGSLKRHGVYAGFDPTAPSLHVGHLLPLLSLFHFQLRGHTVFALIGGATGRVGDPSGRTTERVQTEAERIDTNQKRLAHQVERFFERARAYADKRLPHSKRLISDAIVLNNLQWHKDLTLLDFLERVGRHVRVGAMMSRQSVQTRLASRSGMSFAELTYQLLQAYDFYSLYTAEGVSIQIGGTDQWGNILAGLDLINRTASASACASAVPTDPPADMSEKGFGMLTPLLTDTAGEKWGKSNAGGAVWLDERQTSALDFYQFFLNTSDAEVRGHLRMFTLLPLDEIAKIMNAHNDTPHLRTAQRTLASELTELVHGPKALAHALACTSVLFDADFTNVSADSLLGALAGNPRLKHVTADELLGTRVAQLAARHGLVASVSAARELISQHGLSVNGTRVEQWGKTLTKAELIDGRLAVLRAGKHRHLVLAME